jgi:hypothetical protein
MNLTDSQRRAVEHGGRNLQLIASAGSGKTEVVARRVVHLLTPGRADSLQPRNIIAFTFTDKAAAELKERIITRTRQALGDIPGMAEMFVGTIHAFCLELLKSESPKHLKFEVLNEVQQSLFVDRNSAKSGLTTSTDLAGAAAKAALTDPDQKRWGQYSIQRVFLSFLDQAGVRKERVPDGRGEVVFDNLGKFSQVISDFEAIHFQSKPVEKYGSFADFLELHVLGWAFEANVGEVKSALEKRGRVKAELIMIRPDTLAEGLKVTQPEMLFSPLALPDIEVAAAKNGKEKQVRVTLNGIALFDRKRRTTEYKAADTGYVSAWYLDEDYDGDCFVDCQMFFDFKKAPNIKAALKAEVDPEEFTLKLVSEPFPVRGYKRVAVKVVDVYGNESVVVRDLA